jgi:hypothetical protein
MLIEPFLGISEQWLLGPPNESVWFFTIGPVVDETDNCRRRKTLDDKEGNRTLPYAGFDKALHIPGV